jgi:hypothetical protein
MQQAVRVPRQAGEHGLLANNAHGRDRRIGLEMEGAITEPRSRPSSPSVTAFAAGRAFLFLVIVNGVLAIVPL